MYHKKFLEVKWCKQFTDVNYDRNQRGRGARELMGENIKLVWAVFYYKLGCYDDVHVLMYADAHPDL
jgi:hypothetical protein